MKIRSAKANINVIREIYLVIHHLKFTHALLVDVLLPLASERQCRSKPPLTLLKFLWHEFWILFLGGSRANAFSHLIDIRRQLSFLSAWATRKLHSLKNALVLYAETLTLDRLL